MPWVTGGGQGDGLWIVTRHPWSLVYSASQTSHLPFLPAVLWPSLALSRLGRVPCSQFPDDLLDLHSLPQDLDVC